MAAAAEIEPIQKKNNLKRASTKLDTLRILVRLAKNCDCISNEQYLAIESDLHTVGRMIGGWQKSLH